MIERIQKINPWHIVWMAVGAAVVFTELIGAAMSLLFHGRVTADYLITGAVAAFFVSGAGSALIIAFTQLLRQRDHAFAAEMERASEHNARLAAAVAQSGEGAIMTDTAWNIIFANEAAARITGYAAGEMEGRPYSLFDSGKHPAAFFDRIRESLLRGERWEGLIVCRRKDGSAYEQFTIFSPVANAGGGILNFVAAFRDVSREEMLNRARSYFSIVTSHELRTPISRMLMAQMLVKRANESPDTAAANLPEAERMLASCADDFNAILSTTSLLARLGSGTSAKPMHICYLHPVLTHCATVARERAEKDGRSITITLDLSRLNELTDVRGEQEMLVWAIHELLLNAIRFTPDGGEVTLSAREDKHAVRIAVTDNGIGLAVEEVPHVFEPYFALEEILHHSSGKYRFKSGGMGVGLSIVKLIAALHSAELSVESGGRDRGTAVTLTLPLPPAGIAASSR